MDPNIPVTKEEALKYDPAAIEADIKRKLANIEMFQGEIIKIQAEIQRLYQIKAIIGVSGQSR